MIDLLGHFVPEHMEKWSYDDVSLLVTGQSVVYVVV